MDAFEVFYERLLMSAEEHELNEEQNGKDINEQVNISPFSFCYFHKRVGDEAERYACCNA